jgi:hypothetical protein
MIIKKARLEILAFLFECRGFPPQTKRRFRGINYETTTMKT